MTARVIASTELRLYAYVVNTNYLSCEIDKVRRIDTFCVSDNLVRFVSDISDCL